jgi:putative hydrolases of HD superfamily
VELAIRVQFPIGTQCYTQRMEELLRFVEITQHFKAVRRKVILVKEGREENDAEHSHQLALVAWYLITTENLKLDLGLCLKYALAHDLPEVFAGDTPALGKKYNTARSLKKEREERAMQKLLYEFPEFDEMHGILRAYELRTDEESKFIYALDKILPLMNIYLDKGHSWKVHKISLEEIVKDKSEKVKVSPDIKRYYDLILEKLRSNQTDLFTDIAKS